MLVGVLISIMISIVVGVSLIPTIVDSINTAKSSANAPAGLSGLLDVLSYVFVAVILLGAVKKVAASGSNLCRITDQTRGNLRALLPKAIPNQADRDIGWACVETRGSVSFGMVG